MNIDMATMTLAPTHPNRALTGRRDRDVGVLPRIGGGSWVNLAVLGLALGFVAMGASSLDLGPQECGLGLASGEKFGPMGQVPWPPGPRSLAGPGDSEHRPDPTHRERPAFHGTRSLARCSCVDPGGLAPDAGHVPEVRHPRRDHPRILLVRESRRDRPLADRRPRPDPRAGDARGDRPTPDEGLGLVAGLWTSLASWGEDGRP